MAKAGAAGTPAEASGKKKATTPAKKAKAKSKSPERRVTRSPPRRTTFSTKAQEAPAAAEKVQTGRVTKKTTPAKAKAQTPAKKEKKAAASPASASAKVAKATKATTPVRKTSSPTKATKATTPPTAKALSPAVSGGEKSTKKTAASPAKTVKASSPKKQTTATPTPRTVSQILAGPPKKGRGRPAKKADGDDTRQFSDELYVAIPRAAHPDPLKGLCFFNTFADGRTSRSFDSQIIEQDAADIQHWIEHQLDVPELQDRHFYFSYYQLERAIAILREHDELGLDIASVRRLRPICRHLWTILREIAGDAVDECLDQGVPSHIFGRAMVRVQGPRKKFWSREEGGYNFGWAVEDIVPLELEDVAGMVDEWEREGEERSARRSASPAKHAKSQPPAPAAAAASPSKRARSESPAKRVASPRKASSNAGSEGSLPGYSHRNVRGDIVSPTNPPMIAALNKRNPFHETLPAPEVWHRRMAPYFTFGETPYMQRLASDQIQEDLDRSKALL